MYKYKRPESLDFPQIYYTFNVKDKNSDKIVEYRVQDVPVKYFELVADFMVNHFLPDETLCASRSVPEKPTAVEEFRTFWLETLKEKTSIGCFKNDESDELVGANVLLVNSKDDKNEDNVSWNNILITLTPRVFVTKP